MQWLFMGGGLVLILGFLVIRDLRKKPLSVTGKKRVTPSLQEFLPIRGFERDNTVVVNGRYRRLIRVGDLNLFSMSMEEIRGTRDRFKAMLMRLDHPFQISIQARRANYTDFVKYAGDTVRKTMTAYDNPTFSLYAEDLLVYLQEEAQKPRTDRENLFVIGVEPKLGGQDLEAQLERLDEEQRYVEGGLSGMGIGCKTLGPVEVVEAIQNFWDRNRAVSQRYRDAVERQTQAPRVVGVEEVEGKSRVQKESREKARVSG